MMFRKFVAARKDCVVQATVRNNVYQDRVKAAFRSGITGSAGFSAQRAAGQDQGPSIHGSTGRPNSSWGLSVDDMPVSLAVNLGSESCTEPWSSLQVSHTLQRCANWRTTHDAFDPERTLPPGYDHLTELRRRSTRTRQKSRSAVRTSRIIAVSKLLSPHLQTSLALSSGLVVQF
jgi:hypothetical protein